MKKPSYGWLLKWVLAAVLIAVGFTFLFESYLVYLITGSVIIVFSVFRVKPLVKSLKTETLRTLNIIEIVLDLLIGGVLIFVGVKALQEKESIAAFWGYVYKYGLATFFLLRAIVFFYSTTFLGEKTEQQKFWAHLLLLPLVGAIVANKDFDHEWVGWLLLIVSVLGGLYLIYDGGGGYKKYREYQKELNEIKEKEKPVSKDAPAEDEDPIELPTDVHIPVEEPQEEDERPYVS